MVGEELVGGREVALIMLNMLQDGEEVRDGG